MSEDVPTLLDSISIESFDDEGVLLELESEAVFALNESSLAIVEAIDGERSLSEIAELLSVSAGVDPAEILPDIGDLVAQLRAAGLVH